MTATLRAVRNKLGKKSPALAIVFEYAIESLDPENFDNIERALLQIAKNRKNFPLG